MIKKIDLSLLLLVVFKAIFVTIIAGFGLAAGVIGFIEGIKTNDIGACVVPGITVILMAALIAVFGDAVVDEYNTLTHNEADEG